MKHLFLFVLLLLPQIIFAQCNPQPVPYLQGFDYITSFPQCTYHHNAVIEPGGRTGNRLSLTTTDSTFAYVVFPELQIPSDSAEISFWAKLSVYRSKPSPICVGIVTDTSDIGSSFIPLVYDSVRTNQWTEFRYNTINNPYPTTATARFAIYMPSGIRETIYFDDIDIHHTPSCPRPENITFPHKTSTSLEIAWNGPSTARIDVTDFAQTTSYNVTTNPATITNLQPYTQYTVTITAICAPGDTSPTSLPVTVTTYPNCPHPNNLGITDVHANDFRLSWTSSYGNASFKCAYKLYKDTMLVDSSSFTTSYKYHTFTNVAPLTRHTLTGYIYNDCGGGNHSDTIFFTYSFTTLCNDIYNVYFTDTTDTSVAINIIDPSVTTWQYSIALFGENPDTCPLKLLSTTSDTLHNLTPGTTYYIYTRRLCDQGQIFSPWSSAYTFTTTGTPPHSTCPQPYNCSLDALNPTVVVVDWNDTVAVPQWLITIVPSSGQPFTQVTTYHPAYISGLDTTLAYSFYVSAICSTVDTSAAAFIASIPAHRVVCYDLPSPAKIVNVSDTQMTVTGRRYAQSALQFAIAPYPSYSIADTLYSISAGDTVTFSGLSASTTYTIYMRGICRNAYNADTTNWIATSLSTTAPLTGLPFVCDFENAAQNALWQYVQTQTNQFVISTGVANGGTKSLYVSCNGSSYAYNLNATSYATAYYMVDVPAGDYDYSFDWRCVGHTDYAKARFLLLPASVALDYSLWTGNLGNGNLPAGAIALDKGELKGSNTFNTVTGTFHISTPGTYNIVATWRNYLSSGTNPPIAIDNISIIPQPCSAPAASLISQQGSTATVAVSLAVPGSQLIYGLSTTSGSPQEYDTVAVTSSAFNLTLNNLSGSTTYTLYLMNVCSSGGVSQPTTVQFTTGCGTISALPYVQSFESVAAGISSATLLDTICWTTVNYASKTSGSVVYPTMKVETLQHSDGAKALGLTSFRQEPLFLILPEIQNLSMTKLDFDFKTESSSNACGLVTAGYLTNPADTSTFVPVTATARLTSWTTYSSLFVNAPAGARIAFRYYDAQMMNFYSYLDNIRVTRLTQQPAFNDTICANTDYTLYGFYIPASQLPIGDTTVYSIQQTGQTAYIYTANIHVVPSSYTVVYDTMPAYQPYTRGIFNIPDPQSYFYYATVPSHYGCDSTVELHLTLTLDSVLDTTLCHGETLVVGGKSLTTPGTFTHTWTDNRGIIVTAYITLGFYPAITTDTAIALTNDSVYYWEGVPYVSPGTYTRTFVSSAGCDSVVTLTLTSIFTSLPLVIDGLEVTLIPNPVSPGGILRIVTDEIVEQVTLLSTLGQVLSASSPTDDTLLAPTLPGLYFVTIHMPNGRIISQPLVVK